MEQEFKNIGDFKKFLRHEIPELFVTQMVAALDDDVIKAEQIEKYLRGECDFKENCDVAFDTKVKVVREGYQKWRDSERWLFLSAATSDEEIKQREFEFEHLQKEADIPREHITQYYLEHVGKLGEIVEGFIKKHKGFNLPMNILIFGHGRCVVGIEDGVEVKSGALVANAHAGKQNKLAIYNESVITTVRTITRQHDIGQANRVHLCLFYCYAHEGKTEKMFENFRVITYREDNVNTPRKNPLSTISHDHKDEKKPIISSENSSSVWYPGFRDKEAEENQREVNLHPVSVPEEIRSSPKGIVVIQANSDDSVDNGSVSATVHTSAPSSGADADGERILLVGDSVKNYITDSKEDHAEDDFESGRTVNYGSDGDTGVVGSLKAKTGAGETKQEDTSEPESLCYDGESALELILANEKGIDALRVLSSYPKEQAVITGIEEKAVVELTSENPGGDSQQPRENIPPNPGRQDWVFGAWQRVTNALTYINWYPHM